MCGERAASSTYRERPPMPLETRQQLHLPPRHDLVSEMQRRGWVQIHGAVELATVQALCDEIADELRDPSVPPESGTPRVDLADTSTWPTAGGRRVIEAVPTRGSGGAGCCCASEAWQALIASPALNAALNCLLGEGCWELPLNEPYHGGVVGSEYVRHWYAPVMFPEDHASIEKDSSTTTGSVLLRQGFRTKAAAAALLGDAVSWRTNEGDGWTVEQDLALQRARLPSKEGQLVSWKAVAAAVGGGRTAQQCRERWGGLQPWTVEEDERLLSLYDKYGPAWTKITQQAGLQDRSKRHVRVRVANLLEPGADVLPVAGETTELREERAAAEWEAVNRRRVRGKGWHVDIGPGFSTDWRRTADGHCYQGCVVLVLLTDCAPGQGGTCFVSRSHHR